MNELKDNRYNRKQKSENPNYRKFVDPEVRKFEGELRPLMTEEENGRIHGSTESSFAGFTESRIKGFTDNHFIAQKVNDIIDQL